MKCPKCDVELVSGKALQNSYENCRDGVAPNKKPKSDGTLVDCLKCPICGYSEIEIR